MTNSALRASDDDRQRVVAALEQHTADGRLSLDEFSERVGLVFAAATHGDLAQITSDLPAKPRPTRPESGRDKTQHRQLLIAFLLAAVTLVVLGLVLALGR